MPDAPPPPAPTDAEARAWLESFAARGLAESLGIALVELTPGRVVGTMPVDPRTRQPYGLLHGGASVALAETIASLGAALHTDRERTMMVGLEINANHVRAVRAGVVTGVGAPLHVGRTTQVWEVRITDEAGRLVCVSRCTLAAVPRPEA